jgi:hypothetical protein
VGHFGSRAKAVETEIPSTSLRAGSSLRLKNGYAQDDTVGKKDKVHHYPTLQSTSMAEKLS